jgi:class 3 adenylate cyclase
VGRFLSAVQRHREIDRVLSTIVVLRNSAAPGLAAALVEQHCGAHRGRVLQASSGCWTAAFDGPARAIRAACAIVSEAREAGIDVRGGVHTGECELTGNGVYGPPVVVAAGLAAAAPAGAVLVTRTVTELVAGSPLRFESRGEVAVGDADSTWPIYEAMPNRLSIE